ncbi:MAG: hypothetical protein JXQ73_26845 [Phycisphaerae bacterium]|nr:hypothetical protein [Phycisphaerae bacterium]
MDALRSSILILPVLGLIVSLAGGCAEHERLHVLLDCEPADLVGQISTPAEAAEIIDMRVQRKPDPPVEKADDWQSLTTSMRLEHGDCDDWAIASAALLADDGWPARLLIVGTVRVFFDTQKQLTRRGYCHAVHLLERDGLYGANGVNRCDRFEPQFQTIDEVVRRLPLIQDRWDFYKIIPLDGVDIVSGQGNLFSQVAERYKATQWIDIKYPSRKLSTSVAGEIGENVQPPAGDPDAAREPPADQTPPEPDRRKQWTGR